MLCRLNITANLLIPAPSRNPVAAHDNCLYMQRLAQQATKYNLKNQDDQKGLTAWLFRVPQI
jgi:hypothetical protein